MKPVALKYRVWAVFMFAFGGLFTLVEILLLVNMAKIITTLPRVGNFDYDGYVVSVVLECLLYTAICALITFLYIYGGILLRRRIVKRRGVYIFYGILSILGAVSYLLGLIRWFYDYHSNIYILPFILIMLTGNILTAVLMFSKISGRKEQKMDFRTGGMIRFLSGEYAGSDVNLLQGQRLMLGSDIAQVNLVLHQEKISPYHCVIEYDGINSIYHIADYSSTGTLVNGNRLNIGMMYSFNPGSVVDLAEGDIRLELL